MSESYEGVEIKFVDDFELEISANKKELTLKSDDIKSINFLYEKRYCGCCDGDHNSIELHPRDICFFKTSGGYEKIKEQSKKIMVLEEQSSRLKNKIKKYEEAIRLLKK